jgi:hypothetical protein
VQIFPPLVEIGHFMTNNFAKWGERRKSEIMMINTGLTPDAKIEECHKLDERIVKYREKTIFLNDLSKKRRRRSSVGEPAVSCHVVVSNRENVDNHDVSSRRSNITSHRSTLLRALSSKRVSIINVVTGITGR